jgi:hypothetical protein
MWVGWYRLTAASPWQRACEADTLERCAKRLSEATRGLKLANTNEAITSGTPPRPTRTADDGGEEDIAP